MQQFFTAKNKVCKYTNYGHPRRSLLTMIKIKQSKKQKETIFIPLHCATITTLFEKWENE